LNTKEIIIKLREPHSQQVKFIDSTAKRKVIRAGRRGGKTTGVAILAAKEFLNDKRILYAAPTEDQVSKFWIEIKRTFNPLIDDEVFYKNETKHIIEKLDSITDARIRAKTAWDADTLRGDYADLLILDEYQLMDSNAWDEVGAPMLADNNGDAIFIYTQKRGLNHAKKLFDKAKQDKTGRYETFVFSSFDNPYISKEALNDLTNDMTNLSYRAEILAEDIEDDPGALWKRGMIKYKQPLQLKRIVVGVDPSGSSQGDECGIICAGIDNNGFAYILNDDSLQGSPGLWGQTVVDCYNDNEADRVVGESNYGGEMIETNIRVFNKSISYKAVHATRGKAVRAEPIVAKYEKGLVFHSYPMDKLEDEMCNWIPGDGKSPNRVDALVWALTELLMNPINFFKWNTA
jgi:hypothetical protein